MNTLDVVALDLRRAEDRSALRLRVERVRRTAEAVDPGEAIDALLEAHAVLAAAVRARHGDLQGSALQWSDEERAIASWISEAHVGLATAGSRIAERATDDLERVDDAMSLRVRDLIAAAMASLGFARKWRAMAGERIPLGGAGRAHRLFRLAERLGIARAKASYLREGIDHGLTVEAQYLRVLLLDYLCKGNHSRQQVEILDDWLWTWVTDYRLTVQAEAGEPGLWVDLAGDTGVHMADFAPSGIDVRFLVVGRLRKQLDEVIGGFHSGQIYPGYGASCELRLEEHAAVIDFLEELLGRLQREASSARAQRRSAGLRRVEGFLGLSEIFLRGFADAAPLIKGLGLGLELAEPLASVPMGGRSDDTFAVANPNEERRRWFQLKDASEGGFGLVAEVGPWSRVEVGDLIAIREGSWGVLVVGEAVRVSPGQDPGTIEIGARVLVREPQRLSLKEGKDDGKAVLDALYVPGGDTSGRYDALLVDDPEAAMRNSWAFDFGDASFRVATNRVRARGRGWAAVGYEVVEVAARRQAPASASAPAPARALSLAAA